MAGRNAAGRLGAWCFVLTVEYFLAQAVAQSAWPAYSMRDNFISDLGAVHCGAGFGPHAALVCSPLHAVMNSGFVALGALMLAGILLTWRAWPCGSTPGLLFLAAAAVGEALIGLAPEDVNIRVHILAALLHWIAGGIGMIVLAAPLRKASPRLALVTFLAGAVTLVGLVLFLFHRNLGLGHGGMERVVAYPLTLWFILVGFRLFGAPLRPRSNGAIPAA